jgi:hypothetical protein
MKRIRQIIADMDTPSWLPSVPHNFDEAAAGSLKADEWRTMATVYLPVALVSLWGLEDSNPESSNSGATQPCESSQFHDVLDHTMKLVSAISLACMRTMTTSRMKAYKSCITAWVRNLRKIHPSINHSVNEHMAIHIYDFLYLFGPVRSWWCFPFERLIGQLQRLPHNHKFGTLLSFQREFSFTELNL